MRRDVVEGERQPLGRDFHYHCRVSIAKFLASSKFPAERKRAERDIEVGPFFFTFFRNSCAAKWSKRSARPS
jgi:hypothetical protein